MRPTLTRRGALRVLAAGCALPIGVVGLRALRDVPPPVVWRGEVLGALSGMTLWHPRPEIARRAIRRMLVEIERLETVFSLYRSDSEIARLNRDGGLAGPSADLLAVLDAAQQIAGQSQGGFDPSIQPLWRAFETGDRDGLDRARALVDHRAIELDDRHIRLAKPGMAISLNGIAQGYITDRITDVLAREGFENAMIELGETRALGTAPDGLPFPVGLIDPAAPDRIARDLPLANAALSVSGGYGMRFGAAGDHHIFDPRTGHSANRLQQVAVVSPKALWADALSTAIYVAGEPAAAGLLAAYPASSAMLWRNDGTLHQIAASS